MRVKVRGNSMGMHYGYLTCSKESGFLCVCVCVCVHSVSDVISVFY